MSRLPAQFLGAPIAHRALHDLAAGRPENSPSAIEAACRAGYGIEIDLQLSSDGQAMVFHDYDLNRLTHEVGPVRQRSAQALGQICLRGGTDGIPRLDQVLAQVAGRVPLLIEIKDQDGAMGAGVGALEAAAARTLKRYDGPVAVMCWTIRSAEAEAAARQIAHNVTFEGYPAAIPA